MASWEDDSKNHKGFQPEYTSEEKGYSPAEAADDYEVVTAQQNPLHRELKGRHMQMIAIGGAIGAGLFVGSGASFAHGGPGAVLVCFAIIGIMMMFVMQALAELGVMFPVSGAFYTYAVRFISPSWGFAMGWDYAIQWLTILPFELSAAGLTLQFWKASRNLDIAVWVTVFLVALSIVQVFGIRGYGEVEFVLSIIKICACVGFIIAGIIINVGGVPTAPKVDGSRYIGGRYWFNPGAFRNGFKGFCSVFVNASFAFGGTELTGLAAAEARDPMRTIPRATKQVLWRIVFFYIVSLLIAGLIVPSDNKHLLDAGSAATKYSIFVLGLSRANIPVLPSIFNACICISVLSVANSCAFGSTRTLQSLASHGMAPKFFAYVDKAGRPLFCVILQLAFGLLAYIQDANANASTNFFNWLLALSGLANFFIWGSICFAHIRFRAAWKYQGRSVDELPYKAQFGVIGSWIGVFLNVLCLIASFYYDLFPIGGATSASNRAFDFFEGYLAAPIILALYIFWKVWSREWFFLLPISSLDITTGMRVNTEELREIAQQEKMEKTWGNLPMRVVRSLI